MTDAPILPRFAKVRAEALAAVDSSNMRRIACARCGGGFACNPVGGCWCAKEEYRLPVPLPDEFAALGDCVCPACIRAITTILLARRDAGSR
jgi:hypothetical protein